MDRGLFLMLTALGCDPDNIIIDIDSLLEEEEKRPLLLPLKLKRRLTKISDKYYLATGESILRDGFFSNKFAIIRPGSEFGQDSRGPQGSTFFGPTGEFQPTYVFFVAENLPEQLTPFFFPSKRIKLLLKLVQFNAPLQSA